jgi:tRNA threonylcarbamoyladenosine biosynthesis protein TsaE
MQKDLIYKETHSINTLPIFAEKVMKNFCASDWILLDGDLGSGKTFLSHLLCKSMGVAENTTSPTFSLLNTYKTNHKDIHKIIHLDLYRIQKTQELFFIGLDLEWQKSSIIFCEWPYLVENWNEVFSTLGLPLPNCTYEIKITTGTPREYSFSKLKNNEWIF